VNDIVCILPPDVDVKTKLIEGDVTFGHYTAVGANVCAATVGLSHRRS